MFLARKRSFDLEVVLDQIMIYFWQYGFRKTGFRDLTTATGIKTQSLYNAYGSKDQLYYQALTHYVNVTNQTADQILETDQSADQKLTALLILDWGSRPYPPGCMVISSLSEFDQIDPKLHEVANTLFDHLTSSFMTVLNTMQADLRPDLELSAIAAELLTLHNGIQVAVRDNPDPTTIETITATTIQSIKKV